MRGGLNLLANEIIRVAGSHGLLPNLYTYSMINAPFHKIVAKTPVNTAAPTHHCPPNSPSLKTPSDLNAATPKKNKTYDDCGV